MVGAGLAGLGAAIGLARDGHEVTVMERAAEMEAVGAITPAACCVRGGCATWGSGGRCSDLGDWCRR